MDVLEGLHGWTDRWMDVCMDGWVHDEWQIEVEERYAELAGRLGVMAIEKAGKDLKMRCPLTGEYKVGNSWKETH